RGRGTAPAGGGRRGRYGGGRGRDLGAARRDHQPGRAEEGSVMADKHKVLIVDDDGDLMRGLSVRLTASGYEVCHAVDGAQAVSVASKERPDLILLDLGLPGGSGYVVMKRLKALAPLAQVPIIVLSARDPATDRRPAPEAGAAAYLQKPVDNALLLWAMHQQGV